MYESPNDLLMSNIQTQIIEKQEEAICKAVFDIGVNVKKDAVPVVRCKDCKHWKPGDSMMGNSIEDMQRVGGCEYVRFRRLENDFCSYGERKDNG